MLLHDVSAFSSTSLRFLVTRPPLCKITFLTGITNCPDLAFESLPSSTLECPTRKRELGLGREEDESTRRSDSSRLSYSLNHDPPTTSPLHSPSLNTSYVMIDLILRSYPSLSSPATAVIASEKLTYPLLPLLSVVQFKRRRAVTPRLFESRSESEERA